MSRGAVAAGALALIVALVCAAPAATAATPDRTERRVQSAAPRSQRVAESFVSLRSPLPADAGPRPPQCDWVSYQRVRDARGPKNPAKADAIFVTMPGIFAGASSLDIFARNMVRVARLHGRHIEVWTLDRRSNCLEDHSGIDAGARAHDYRLALNYYFHGATVDGHKFAGFNSEQDAAFLKAVGLGQTVRDEYTVITRGIPAKLRTKKVFCGGHSLGGPLTTAFAGWDFDGNPATTADAGYNQCAAYFALDTRLELSIGGGPSGAGGGGGGSSSVGLANVLAGASNGSPYVNATPFTPETIEAVPNLALAAFTEPRLESQVTALLPDDSNFQAAFRALFSRDAANAITQMPNIRDFRVTNEAALAATFDDNSTPVTILRASLGTFARGQVAQKSFPAPYGQTLADGLIDGKHLMIPIEPHGPLYTWWHYDQFGQPGTPDQRDDSGQPFTSGASEVTDIDDFARSVFDAPADFAEQYFPTRLLAEQSDAGGGDRSGDLQNLRYDGIPKHPQFYADADHGIEDGADPPPKGPGPSGWIKLPGYDHIDVATAALVQAGGKPERESAGLWAFASKIIPPPAARDERRVKRHRRHRHHHRQARLTPARARARRVST